MANSLMMGAYVVLALVVCKILLPGVPFNFVDILCFFVTNPKRSHFHRSRSLSFDSVIRDTNSGCIIAMYRRFWLGMSEVSQCLPENYAVLTIVEKSAEFGFRR